MNNSRRRMMQVAMLGTSSALAASMTGAFSTQVIGADTSNSTRNDACNALLSHELRPLMGPERRPLCEKYGNKVLLIVNTASKCGFTHQFEDLEKLHQRYLSEGFLVLGFPSGDFRQELENEADVAEFCELNYGVTFPMFEKISVTGKSAHPLYQQLAQATGKPPRWNFNKYLVNRNGDVLGYYPSSAIPMGPEIVADIEALL